MRIEITETNLYTKEVKMTYKAVTITAAEFMKLDKAEDRRLRNTFKKGIGSINYFEKPYKSYRVAMVD